MARFLLRMTKFVLRKFTDEQCTPLPWYKEIIAMRQTLIIILTPSLFTNCYMDEHGGKLCVCDPDNGRLLDDRGVAGGCNSTDACRIDAVA